MSLFEPMQGQHRLDNGFVGVTAEIVDYDPQVWKRGTDEEEVSEVVQLESPLEGKMMRVSVTGRAVFYLTSDQRIILDREA